MTSGIVGRLLASAGPRWALVTDHGTEVDGAQRPAAVVVNVGASRMPQRSVRGALDAWPVLSESVTGAVVVLRDGADASAAVEEAQRVLQPGGVVHFIATWRARDLPGFVDALRAAGLSVTRRRAIRCPDAPGRSIAAWFPSFGAARAAADDRIECAVSAQRSGGHTADLPTSRDVLTSMFVPRGFARRRVAEE